MTYGEKYIKENYLKELSYEEAINESIKEANAIGINCRDDIYENEEMLDNPIFPCNIELYDEFCDDYGFDTFEYFSFIAKRMDIKKELW